MLKKVNSTWKKRNETRESMGMNEKRCRVGLRLVSVSCGAVLPISRMGMAASPMSATRYWLSLGSVPIWRGRRHNNFYHSLLKYSHRKP